MAECSIWSLKNNSGRGKPSLTSCVRFLNHNPGRPWLRKYCAHNYSFINKEKVSRAKFFLCILLHWDPASALVQLQFASQNWFDPPLFVQQCSFDLPSNHHVHSHDAPR